MKIVIDIPEHIYDHAIERSEDSNDEWYAMRAIAKCTPLPKGHGRLIDERKMLVRLKEWYTNDAVDMAHYNFTFGRIIESPTIIEADKEEGEEA